MLCPQKFWLSYGEPSLELSAPKPALSFGTAIHEAMKVRHTGGDLAKQEEAIQAHFLANPAEDGQPRNSGRAIEALRAYDKAYPSEDWTILGVEEEFSTELGSFDWVQPPLLPILVRVKVAGRKDLRVLWRGLRWVVDHKTGSEFGPSVIDNDHRSFQAKLYLWHEGTIPGAEIGGFLFNHIVCRSLTGKFPHTFHREPVFLTEEQLSLWKEKTLSLAKEIITRWQASSFPEFETACSHWGRCPFYDLCEAPLEKRPALLGSGLYRRREVPVQTNLTPQQ
jgi:hypothetical protein